MPVKDIVYNLISLGEESSCCRGVLYFLNKESQNPSVWKRSWRSGPNIKALFRPRLNHSPNATSPRLLNTSTRFHHFPGQPIPMLNHPFGKNNIFLDIKSKYDIMESYIWFMLLISKMLSVCSSWVLWLLSVWKYFEAKSFCVNKLYISTV